MSLCPVGVPDPHANEERVRGRWDKEFCRGLKRPIRDAATLFPHTPGVETAGYCQRSLRDRSYRTRPAAQKTSAATRRRKLADLPTMLPSAACHCSGRGNWK